MFQSSLPCAVPEEPPQSLMTQVAERKEIIFSLDYDGCFSSPPIRQELFTIILQLLKDKPFCRITLIIGSARQSIKLNNYNRDRNKNGCCFRAMRDFYNRLISEDNGLYKDRLHFCPLLLEDIEQNTEPGYHLGRGLNSFEIDESKPLECLDENKIALMLVHAHFLHNLLGASFEYRFFDDRKDILSKIEGVYSQNRTLLPQCTFKLYLCQLGTVNSFSLFHGEGEYDANYKRKAVLMSALAMEQTLPDLSLSLYAEQLAFFMKRSQYRLLYVVEMTLRLHGENNTVAKIDELSSVAQKRECISCLVNIAVRLRKFDLLQRLMSSYCDLITECSGFDFRTVFLAALEQDNTEFCRILVQMIAEVDFFMLDSTINSANADIFVLLCELKKKSGSTAVESALPYIFHLLAKTVKTFDKTLIDKFIDAFIPLSPRYHARLSVLLEQFKIHIAGESPYSKAQLVEFLTIIPHSDTSFSLNIRQFCTKISQIINMPIYYCEWLALDVLFSCALQGVKIDEEHDEVVLIESIVAHLWFSFLPKSIKDELTYLRQCAPSLLYRHHRLVMEGISTHIPVPEEDFERFIDNYDPDLRPGDSDFGLIDGRQESKEALLLRRIMDLLDQESSRADEKGQNEDVQTALHGLRIMINHKFPVGQEQMLRTIEEWLSLPCSKNPEISVKDLCRRFSPERTICSFFSQSNISLEDRLRELCAGDFALSPLSSTL